MNRKKFLANTLLLGAVAGINKNKIFSQESNLFEAEEIYEFVAAAHKDFEATKSIIESKPLLLNCANQIRKGDFETALGGASHMGLRDIADLLVSKGARMDIFNHAFLGHKDLVMYMITTYPQLLMAPGPHGFTLLHHAQVGEHTELASWIQEKGLTETFFKGAF